MISTIIGGMLRRAIMVMSKDRSTERNAPLKSRNIVIVGGLYAWRGFSILRSVKVWWMDPLPDWNPACSTWIEASRPALRWRTNKQLENASQEVCKYLGKTLNKGLSAIFDQGLWEEFRTECSMVLEAWVKFSYFRSHSGIKLDCPRISLRMSIR